MATMNTKEIKNLYRKTNREIDSLKFEREKNSRHITVHGAGKTVEDARTRNDVIDARILELNLVLSDIDGKIGNWWNV